MIKEHKNKKKFMDTLDILTNKMELESENLSLNSCKSDSESEDGSCKKKPKDSKIFN